MWWAALLVVAFLVLGLRGPAERRAGLHAVTLLAIVAVLIVAFMRMPTYPKLP